MAFYGALIQGGPDGSRDDYSALDDRYRTGALMGQTTMGVAGFREGVVYTGPDGALKVHAQPTPDDTVVVNAGQAVLRTSIPMGGAYIGTSTADFTVTIAPKHSTLRRTDSIIVKIDDPEAGDAERGFTIEVLTGTPASSPVPPALPDTGGCLLLAMVQVDPGTGPTVIPDSRVYDYRTFTSAAGGVVPHGGATSHPAYPVEGQLSWNLEDHHLEVFNGSAWKPFGPGFPSLFPAVRSYGTGASITRGTTFTEPAPVSVSCPPGSILRVRAVATVYVDGTDQQAVNMAFSTSGLTAYPSNPPTDFWRWQIPSGNYVHRWPQEITWLYQATSWTPQVGLAITNGLGDPRLVVYATHYDIQVIA